MESSASGCFLLSILFPVNSIDHSGDCPTLGFYGNKSRKKEGLGSMERPNLGEVQCLFDVCVWCLLSRLGVFMRRALCTNLSTPGSSTLEFESCGFMADPPSEPFSSHCEPCGCLSAARGDRSRVPARANDGKRHKRHSWQRHRGESPH